MATAKLVLSWTVMRKLPRQALLRNQLPQEALPREGEVRKLPQVALPGNQVPRKALQRKEEQKLPRAALQHFQPWEHYPHCFHTPACRLLLAAALRPAAFLPPLVDLFEKHLGVALVRGSGAPIGRCARNCFWTSNNCRWMFWRVVLEFVDGMSRRGLAWKSSSWSLWLSSFM